jgi:hypothetical protein
LLDARKRESNQWNQSVGFACQAEHREAIGAADPILQEHPALQIISNRGL